MLTIENLTKIFNRGTVNEKIALDKVNLTAADGDFITIIGSNGAGKSTLMNCISGVERADGGRILLDDQDITKLPEYKRSRRIGRVFQDPMKGTAYDMTIEENLAIAGCKQKIHGLQPGISKQERDFFRQQLALLGMGLEDRITQKVKLLSGGQRQALTLFMAVMTKPRLLLLDEHTAALDPATAKKVLDLTDEFAGGVGENSESGSRGDKLCTLMITHNMADALAHGNRTILMDGGRIVMDISGAERSSLTVENLIEKFEIANDRMLLK